ncbi:hypothetical protein RB594_003370 [Gaeumannomyces avenae]
MQMSLTTVLFGLVALAAAMPGEPLMARQNQGRPVPQGTCCVANTSLKQDSCQAAGGAGKCVPGGNDCGGRLSCVAQANLLCDNNVKERNGNLCRAKAAGNKLFDGGNLIDNLGQAKVN